MTNEQAIALVKTATTVQDWNAKRRKVQNSVSYEQWKELHSTIDASGLIVKVLGADEPHRKEIKTEQA